MSRARFPNQAISAIFCPLLYCTVELRDGAVVSSWSLVIGWARLARFQAAPLIAPSVVSQL